MAKDLKDMTDEERYGKVGAEIRRLDPEAYKNRPKSAEGNLALLKSLREKRTKSPGMEVSNAQDAVRNNPERKTKFNAVMAARDYAGKLQNSRAEDRAAAEAKRRLPAGNIGLSDSDASNLDGMKKGGKVEPKAMMKKEIEFFKKKGAPKSMIKHEEKEAKGKVVKMARGGGVESKGKTRGRFV